MRKYNGAMKPTLFIRNRVGLACGMHTWSIRCWAQRSGPRPLSNYIIPGILNSTEFTILGLLINDMLKFTGKVRNKEADTTPGYPHAVA